MDTNRKPPRRDQVKRGRAIGQSATAGEFDGRRCDCPQREGGPMPERLLVKEKGGEGPNRTADARKRGTAGE